MARNPVFDKIKTFHERYNFLPQGTNFGQP